MFKKKKKKETILYILFCISLFSLNKLSLLGRLHYMTISCCSISSYGYSLIYQAQLKDIWAVSNFLLLHKFFFFFFFNFGVAAWHAGSQFPEDQG